MSQAEEDLPWIRRAPLSGAVPVMDFAFEYLKRAILLGGLAYAGGRIQNPFITWSVYLGDFFLWIWLIGAGARFVTPLISDLLALASAKHRDAWLGFYIVAIFAIPAGLVVAGTYLAAETAAAAKAASDATKAEHASPARP